MSWLAICSQTDWIEEGGVKLRLSVSTTWLSRWEFINRSASVATGTIVAVVGPAIPAVVEVLEPIRSQKIAHYTGPSDEWAGMFAADKMPDGGEQDCLVFHEKAVDLFYRIRDNTLQVAHEAFAKQAAKGDSL